MRIIQCSFRYYAMDADTSRPTPSLPSATSVSEILWPDVTLAHTVGVNWYDTLLPIMSIRIIRCSDDLMRMPGGCQQIMMPRRYLQEPLSLPTSVWLPGTLVHEQTCSNHQLEICTTPPQHCHCPKANQTKKHLSIANQTIQVIYSDTGALKGNQQIFHLPYNAPKNVDMLE